MGACSSKPKTTEFEGSTEPLKEAEVVAADRSLESVDTAQISQSHEPGKQEIGAADVNAEASQQTSQLIASKDAELLVKGLSSTEEGVSYSVKANTDAVDEEACNNTAESGKVVTGDVQKVDEGVGAADTKEVSDNTTTVDRGVRGPQDKDFEDKAVVLNEAGAGMENAYVDKGVAVDDEKEQDSGTAMTQDEQSKTLHDISESPGAESPIIGVVQPADPVHVDNVSESVGLATLETPAPVDSTVPESPVEIERDVSTATTIALTEEAANLSPALPQETSEENKEVLHDDPKGSPLFASVSDDGVVQESGADDTRGKEELRASTDAQDAKGMTEPENVHDPQNDIDARTTKPQEENALDESAKESHAEVPENEGNAEVVDEPELEALKVVEAIDTETSTEPKAGTTLEQAIKEQDDRVAEELVANDTQPQTLGTEEPSEHGKPEASPDEVIAEPSAETECKEVVKPHIEKAAANKEKVESVDAGNQELSVEQEKNGPGEGDLAFEDASDVPLKVESCTIEPGDTHSS